MHLTEELMSTQYYDEVNEYRTLDYTKKPYRQEEFKEEMNSSCKILFGFETITSGEKHMPCLCWICDHGIQHEFVGVGNCATDMVNALPIDKNEIILIAHNSDYDRIFILKCSKNIKSTVKSNRFSPKPAYYNQVFFRKIRKGK